MQIRTDSSLITTYLNNNSGIQSGASEPGADAAVTPGDSVEISAEAQELSRESTFPPPEPDEEDPEP